LMSSGCVGKRNRRPRLVDLAKSFFITRPEVSATAP
jgi:hypothetical protein